MRPAVTQLGLDQDGAAPEFLMEALRSLSGRLALRLLSSPSQVQGALGMTLSRLFLEAYGLLQEAIVIPLDADPELAQHAGDPSAPQFRGDLLVVSADPQTRQLDFLLVETKCHAGSGIGAELRATIAAQLGSSENALREAFDPLLHDPDRIDRNVQSWQLASVLNFYLERAVRYGLIAQMSSVTLRQFFNDLEAGYNLSMK
jgi:DNA phosphorothioation-dependent restriction protein DptH